MIAGFDPNLLCSAINNKYSYGSLGFSEKGGSWSDAVNTCDDPKIWIDLSLISVLKHQRRCKVLDRLIK